VIGYHEGPTLGEADAYLVNLQATLAGLCHKSLRSRWALLADGETIPTVLWKVTTNESTGGVQWEVGGFTETRRKPC
jgi:hypothetical protein